MSFITAHWMTIALVLAYLALAFINNLPKPGTSISGYEYFYNVLQTILNNPVVKKFEQTHPAVVPEKTNAPDKP